jgi:hypothetical protein
MPNEQTKDFGKGASTHYDASNAVPTIFPSEGWWRHLWNRREVQREPCHGHRISKRSGLYHTQPLRFLP